MEAILADQAAWAVLAVQIDAHVGVVTLTGLVEAACPGFEMEHQVVQTDDQVEAFGLAGIIQAVQIAG